MGKKWHIVTHLLLLVFYIVNNLNAKQMCKIGEPELVVKLDSGKEIVYI